MKLKANFSKLGNFIGFSVWLPDSGDCGDWSTASDYKTVVLSYLRAQIEKEQA